MKPRKSIFLPSGKPGPRNAPILSMAIFTMAGTAALSHAATYSAGTAAELLSAINAVNSGSGGDTINITGNITLNAYLPAITKSVTINGGGNTISGNNSYRIFTITAGNVSIQNANLNNGMSLGGNGGNGGSTSDAGNAGGGGGAGAGFVLTGAGTSGASASGSSNGSGSNGGGSGGAGGGPSLPQSGAGGSFGAGGGGSGGASGYYSGFTSAGLAGTSTFGGGNGGRGGSGYYSSDGWGFTDYEGGGGGGGGSMGAGGAVFAATGASVSFSNVSFSSNSAVGGNGGNGGNATDGNGGYGGRGGNGGSGYGGAVFIQSGSTLNLQSAPTFSGNSVSGGAGGSGGTGTQGAGGSGSSGAAIGANAYLMAGSSIEVSSGRIDMPSTSISFQSGMIYKTGSGTLGLQAPGTGPRFVINGGTLAVSGGFGAVTNNSVLQLEGTAQSSGTISGTGQVIIANGATATMSGNNSYSGGTLLNAGTLNVGHPNALGSGAVEIAGGSIVIGQGIHIANTIRLTGGDLQFNVGVGSDLATMPEVFSTVGGFDTYASFLAGSASGIGTIEASFSATSSASNDLIRESAVFNVTGVPVVNASTGETDIFVLQLSALTASPGAFLAWFDPASELWVNAVDGNFNSNATVSQSGYEGSFAEFQVSHGSNLEDYVGAWGSDADTGFVWAVLNHNSSFAVAVPEASTILLAGFGFVALLGVRRRPDRLESRELYRNPLPDSDRKCPNGSVDGI